jgi:hypothetical protein
MESPHSHFAQDSQKKLPAIATIFAAVRSLRNFKLFSPPRLWRERNRHAVRAFWARAVADAMGVKQELVGAGQQADDRAAKRGCSPQAAGWTRPSHTAIV